ncbi:hypothetical protein KGY91_18295 [Enterobacter hormaechei]|uniref:hypothetical protein n=1 Tax=Enterobacter hormaechei TaxID=158836 RepID=UPI002092189F|nr:hypothetical protein [Enterobacter hormaechei]MCO6599436.1 hypothetical protein [Enterobacter hormaechei]MCO6609979.1 hypothetical protein [Enterobacter hormaechei]MCO6623177.1 hypothetical protein [Enterobacter hormaechei]MCO6627952.1 hypothetical protein [Enterobacter hormaechei]MCO6636427.1 hypothetical protein [Enterobacter hormaechei]
MTTILIAQEVQEDKIHKIEELLHEVALRDVNFNGVHFEIERGDFTCIPDDESADAVKLLNKIQEIISGY